MMRRTLGVALALAAFNAIVQLESYVFYASRQADGVLDHLAFLLGFPFLQLENLAVAALLAALTPLALRSRPFARLYLVALLFGALLIPVSQVSYRTFLDHMSLAQTDGGLADLATALPALASSFAADVTPLFFFNLVLWAWLGVVLWRLLGAGEGTGSDAVADAGNAGPHPTLQPPQPLLPARPAGWALLGLAYAAIAVPVSGAVPTYNLHRHPFTGLVREERPSIAVVRARFIPEAELRRPRWGEHREDPPQTAALVRAAAALRDRPAPPNVVMVVLESVGGKQLLPDGRPDPRRTPELARRADRMVAFPDVYAAYPGTTRAHVPMVTGGRGITWGGVGDELVHRYTGATLPGELRRLGYATGLFAAVDLEFGYLLQFYRGMPWDTILHYGKGDGPIPATEMVHSWGANDDVVRKHALDWIDRLPPDRPFFLSYQPVATHHPYGTWGGHRGPFPDDELEGRYYNSLHNTDAALGRLLDDLEARGRLDNTLVVITGDHGQAFARLHPNNWTHKSFLYEENVRSFLLLLDRRLAGGPVVARRIADHGDVAPTILTAIGAPAADMPGRNLLAPSFEPRNVFFHKGANPAQWGLRDGRWKLIARIDGADAELYDLESDPDEQHDLAGDAAFAERIAEYRTLLTDWYLRTNYDYIDRLEGFTLPEEAVMTRDGLTGYGARSLQVGYFRGDTGEDFRELPVMHPNQPIYIFTRWNMLPADLDITVQLVAPSRTVHEHPFRVEDEWVVSWFNPGLDVGKEEGRWQVRLWHGPRLLIEGEFRVDSKVAPALRRR